MSSLTKAYIAQGNYSYTGHTLTIHKVKSKLHCDKHFIALTEKMLFSIRPNIIENALYVHDIFELIR